MSIGYNSFTVTMNEMEARSLLKVLGTVGGDRNGPRKHIDEIIDTLLACGVKPVGITTGEVYLGEE